MQDRVPDLVCKGKPSDRLTEILTEKYEIFTRLQPPVRSFASGIRMEQRYLESQQLEQAVHRCRGGSVSLRSILFLQPAKEP